MKHQLLVLSLFSFVASAAQAQWVNQSVPFTPTASVSTLVDAVDANTIWVTPSLTGANFTQQFARSTNAGNTWNVGTISSLGREVLITGLCALDASTAWVCAYDNDSGSGYIRKTVDGGTTWTGPGVEPFAYVANSSPFPFLIHFFNANDGVAVGDPTSGTSFDIFTTANGGTSWNRVASAPTSLAQEGGVFGSFAVSGNSLWFPTDQGRVYYSTNKGLSWSVSNTNLGVDLASIAFSSATDGLALASADFSTNPTLARTTNGGATWTTVSYTGPLRAVAIDNVPGTNQYLSVGIGLAGNLAGSSYSRDNGSTWINLESANNYISLDVASTTVAWAGGLNLAPVGGQGIYKLTSTILNARPDAATQRALSVYPNPSLDGVFTLHLTNAVAQPTDVRVTDAVGREVYRTVLSAAATSAPLDLHRQRAGLYTLELQSAAGVARQKLVIE